MPTWIRVRDDITGDEYDLDQRSVRAGVTPIEGYPQHTGPGARPRPAKHAVAKDGTRAEAARAQLVDETAEETNTEPAAPPADTTEENTP